MRARPKIDGKDRQFDTDSMRERPPLALAAAALRDESVTMPQIQERYPAATGGRQYPEIGADQLARGDIPEGTHMADMDTINAAYDQLVPPVQEPQAPREPTPDYWKEWKEAIGLMGLGIVPALIGSASGIHLGEMAGAQAGMQGIGKIADLELAKAQRKEAPKPFRKFQQFTYQDDTGSARIGKFDSTTGEFMRDESDPKYYEKPTIKWNPETETFESLGGSVSSPGAVGNVPATPRLETEDAGDYTPKPSQPKPAEIPGTLSKKPGFTEQDITPEKKKIPRKAGCGGK